MGIGQEIRRRRLALGWSQRELALRAGVHPNSIAAYESGKREPYLSSADLILGAMGYCLKVVPMAVERSK